MTRVLIAIDDMIGAGAERSVANLLSGLTSDVIKPVLVQTLRSACDYALPSHVPRVDLRTQSPRARVLKPAAWLLASTYAVGRRSARNSFSSLRADMSEFLESRAHGLMAFDSVVRAHKPDVILSVLLPTNLVVLAWHALTRSRIPLAIADHTSISAELDVLPYLGRVHKLLVRALYPRADAYVAVADGVVADAVATTGVSARRVRTIHNGIDVEHVRQRSREPLAERHPLLDRAAGTRILALGRLSPEKGFDVLLGAFARFLQRTAGTVFLAGKDVGGEEVRLRRQAHALGISERVRFLGFEPNPFACMANTDLLVVPSRREACPMVLLEGMAVGVPIIATDSPGGTSELLARGKHGVLCPVDDAPALADAMLQLATDTDRRATLASTGPDGARVFSLEKMVDGYRSLFSELAAGRR